MNRTFRNLALALLVSAGAYAATVQTTLTVTNATGTLGTSVTFSGPATLTGIGSATFSTTVPLTPDANQNLSGPFSLTISAADKITGTFSLPVSAISGTSFTGAQVTITGGTGAYAGATGSFPSLSGSATIGLSITLSFSGAGTIVTGGTGGGGTSTAPAITAVQDAAGNTATIAQGSIFIVKGSNLSASGFTSFPPPRPQASAGVKVTFTPTAGGAGTDAYLVYLYNQSGVNQIAGILPSTVAVGNYNVTVTNGTVSAAVATQVVANKLALFTQDSTGTGLASVQNYISAAVVDLNRLTTGSVSGVTYSPAKPGQPVIAYGTGLGAYAAGDNTASPAFDFSKTLTIQAIVGGVTVPVAYAGRAGYAGEDQINFTLPANVQTGCAVPLQISVNGKLSPTTSIAIAPDSGSSACVFPGYTTAQLQNLDQGKTITTGAFTITQFAISTQGVTAKSNSISGGFAQLNGFQLSSVTAQSNVNVLQAGSCQVIQTTSTGTTPSSGGNLTYLDAGTVSVTGPSGSSLSNTALTKTKNAYSLSSIDGFSIPGQASFSLPAGSYSLAGGGGPDVGTFSTSITIGSPLTITGGLPSIVLVGSPLTLSWTGGGASSDLVEIIGSTSTSTGTGTATVTSSATFICLSTVGAGGFTVPGSITGQMYKTTNSNPGVLEVASGNASTTFHATQKSDSSDITGIFASFLGIGNTPTYQ